MPPVPTGPVLTGPGPGGGGAARPGPAQGDPGQVGAAAHLGDPPGPGLARVGVVQRVHVGQQDERPGPDHVRDQRGQPVVVAEPDLVRGHRVVLVDDRQDPEFEQPAQGALGVPVVRTAHQVIGAQQYLAGADAVPGERGGVPGDQQALSHARGGLLGGQVTGPARQPQRGQPGRDGSRGDQHDLGAAPGPGRERVGQGRDPVLVDPAPRGGQRRGAHLDHHRAGVRDPRPQRRLRGLLCLQGLFSRWLAVPPRNPVTHPGPVIHLSHTDHIHPSTTAVIMGLLGLYPQ